MRKRSVGTVRRYVVACKALQDMTCINYTGVDTYVWICFREEYNNYITIARSRPDVTMIGLDTTRAGAIGPRPWTLAREAAFRDGRSVYFITIMDIAGAPARRAPAVVNCLANCVRAGLAGPDGAARLLGGLSELWASL